VNADGRDVQFAVRRALVERLDVLQNVLELKAMRRNQVLRQPVEHESIIRVGRVAQCQFLRGRAHSMAFFIAVNKSLYSSNA
jgi:hypothetical protein